MENNIPEEKPKNLLGRILRSIQEDPIVPENDQGRMRMVINSLILHIHPTKTSKAALKFNYTFGLGGLLILLFVMLSMSGVLLIFNYTPSPEEAYNSMLALQTEVNFGNLIRNIHHWSGNLMVIVGVLHLLRVFFTKGYSRPREFNWTLGVTLLLFIIAANFTGYLLPWDQLAYWAVTVGTSILQYIPVVGDALTNLLLGGPEVGAATLTNFYGLHVAIIPLSIFAVFSFHIWRVRKNKISVPKQLGKEVDNSRVTTIPHLVSIELVFAVVWIALLLVWSTFVNAPLEEAANPMHSPNPAKAAWYFMGFQELLLHFHPIFAAVIIPGVGLISLFLIPYQDEDDGTTGVWFRSRLGRVTAAWSAFVGVVGTFAFVWLDERWIDLPAWLPFLPNAISNGWIPMAALLLMLIGYAELLKKFNCSKAEITQAIFSLLAASFISFTVVGIFFRGAGMALVLPWA